MLNRLPLRILSPALVLSISLSACLDEDGGKTISSTGTVVYNPIEGGFYGIIDRNGDAWDPDNLPDALAVDSLQVSFHGVATDGATSHMWGRTMHLVGVERIGDPPAMNLEPFRELARKADCADRSNRLFLIDEHLVFWDRESSCADAAYSRALYGRTVSHLMCLAEDSVAGPRQVCHDRDVYAEMFKIIVDNLDREDLGLGTKHTVKPVEF